MLDLGFWYLVEEAWTRTQNRFICISKKIEKITYFEKITHFHGQEHKIDSYVYLKKIGNFTHFEGGSLEHYFHSICFILVYILFQFIFASFFFGQAKLRFR